MFNLSLSVFGKKSTPHFKVGDLVVFNGLTGRVIRFGISPYWDEEQLGIPRAYVEPIDDSWQGTAYWPVADGLEAR